MIVLDTNAISEFMKPVPSPTVRRWFASVASEPLATTVISIAELKSGLAFMPIGRRRSAMLQAMEHLVASPGGVRLLPFQEDTCDVYAQMCAARRRVGRHVSTADLVIASICHVAEATLATRNVTDSDETGISVINPWDAQA